MCDTSIDEVDDAVSLLCEGGVVCDHEEGFLCGLVEFSHEGEDGISAFGVEVSGGFIGEDEDGVIGECAEDGDALLLSTGELVGAVFDAFAEADLVEEFGHTLCIGLFDLAAFEAAWHEDIFEDVEFGQEVVELEDEAEVVAS